jgi:nucleotide-binding universal stress UspA family protein
MKIMATFDGSTFAEAIIPMLLTMADLPEAELTLVAIAPEPHPRARTSRRRLPSASVMGASTIVVVPPPEMLAETALQAPERVCDALSDYLDFVAAQFPETVRIRHAVHVARDAGAAIVRQARTDEPDVIVMATHGHSGLVRALFGATAEAVVRSGVAPVLLIHPEHRPRRREAATAKMM